jgi:hypothetical protein
VGQNANTRCADVITRRCCRQHGRAGFQLAGNRRLLTMLLAGEQWSATTPHNLRCFKTFPLVALSTLRCGEAERQGLWRST